MDETRYSISDAAKQVNVEAHVLRYWEEELELNIPRNELGHRYYTEDTIHMFDQVKQLKEYGYQLKAIKMILPRLKEMDESEFHFLRVLSDEMNRRASEGEEMEKETAPANVIQLNVAEHLPEQNEKMEQFQQIMTEVLRKAIVQSKEEIVEEISENIGNRVSERMLKEMDYEMRRREEQEEEHFRKLDAAIRQYQGGGAEAAAAGRKKKKRARKSFWKPYRDQGSFL